MTNAKKSIIKMLILVFGVTAVFFSARTAHAAGRDLVGSGTTILARPVASADDTTPASDASAEQTQAGTGSESGNQTGSGQSQEQGQTAQTGGETTQAGGQATYDSKGTQRAAAVETGVMSQIYPFLSMLAVHFALFALFVHLRLNQNRYAYDWRYARELGDFHWKMQHLDD